MTPEKVQETKQQFIDYCHQYIKREGIDSMLAWLESSDFFTAPSSTKFHLNEDGGLCRHSLNVFEAAKKIYEGIVEEAIKNGTSPFEKELTIENIAIAALFHDLCKVGLYHKAERWRKENNQWVSYMGYDIVNKFPLGHGEKSLFIVKKHIPELTLDEMLAIRWHMGMFDVGDGQSDSRRSFYEATDVSPLVSIVSAADFMVSKCLEKTTE